MGSNPEEEVPVQDESPEIVRDPPGRTFSGASSKESSSGPREGKHMRRKERKHSKAEVKGEEAARARTGKPSRRWLMTEIERLQASNAQLARIIAAKEDIELELVEEKSNLQKELKAMLSGGQEVDALRVRNRDLSQDVFLLKNLVVRLNHELERVSSIGKPNEESEETRPKREKWRGKELGVLAPLLEAYDESLREKTELVAEYRSQTERLAVACKAVAAENTALRNQIKEADEKGEVTYSEWSAIQRETALYREQNQLLTRQAKLAQAKMSELRATFQSKLDECARERESALECSQSARTELFLLKGRHSALQEELTALKDQADAKVPQSVHNASINECKRLFEELKGRYEAERDALLKRIASLESSKTRLEEQLTLLAQERDQLTGRLDQLTQFNKASERKVTEACGEAEELRGRTDALHRELRSAVHFSGELLAEREALLTELGKTEKRRSHEEALAARLSKLKIQLQSVEKWAKEDCGGRLAEMADTKLSQQSRQIASLEAQLARSEATIAQLSSDKRKAEEDVGIIWAATNATKAE